MSSIRRLRKAAPRLVAALLCVAMPAAAMAGTTASCIPVSDLRPVLNFALPELIDGVSQACHGLLAGDAFLSRSGTALAARYRHDAGSGWDQARIVIERAMGDRLPKTLSPETERMMITDILRGVALSKVKAGDCEMVNRLVQVLAPLPAENLTELGLLILAFGSRHDRGGTTGGFQICPPAAETSNGR